MDGFREMRLVKLTIKLGVVSLIKIFITLSLLFVVILPNTETVHSQTLSYPCSVVLFPVNDIPNAQGTALIVKLKHPYTELPTSPLRERQSVGIYADWLPSPASFGDYDQYEGLLKYQVL